MCALHFFFIVEPCAEFTCFPPLVLCHSHFLSWVNAQQWSPRKNQALPSIESFRPFLLALSFPFIFLFCQLTIHDRALHGCLCVASFKLLMKNIWLPNVMCFCATFSHHSSLANACLKKANPWTESYTLFQWWFLLGNHNHQANPHVHQQHSCFRNDVSVWVAPAFDLLKAGATQTETSLLKHLCCWWTGGFAWRIVHVGFPYTLRRSTLSELFHKPVESTRSEWNDTRAWSETTPKA